MTYPMTNNAQAELVGRLRGYCIDWNDQPIPDNQEPRCSPTSGEVRAVCAEIERMAGEVERLSEALKLAEIALRLDGERMRAKYMSTLQNEASLDAVQRALGGGE